MPRLLPLIDAAKLAKSNQTQLRLLEQSHAELAARAEKRQKHLDEAFSAAYTSYLAPFAETFVLIKNVTLDELPATAVVPELADLDVEVRKVGVNAVQGLTTLAGGTAAGAAGAALTFTAVSALATASTGTAIAGLSGAAATSATLAWLGGGSLAAGGMGVAGGTVVLTGLVAAPAILALAGFLYWQGKKALREQEKIRVDLRTGEVELRANRERLKGVFTRFWDTAFVTRRLTNFGVRDLDRLSELVKSEQDFCRYSQADKNLVARLAGLATTLAAVLACPIVDANGYVTELSTSTVAVAERLADRLAA